VKLHFIELFDYLRTSHTSPLATVIKGQIVFPRIGGFDRNTVPNLDGIHCGAIFVLIPILPNAFLQKTGCLIIGSTV
jgi:hypothetical protein